MTGYRYRDSSAITRAWLLRIYITCEHRDLVECMGSCVVAGPGEEVGHKLATMLSELHEILQDDIHRDFQTSCTAVDIGGRLSTEQAHLLKCLADTIPVRTRDVDPASCPFLDPDATEEEVNQAMAYVFGAEAASQHSMSQDDRPGEILTPPLLNGRHTAAR